MWVLVGGNHTKINIQHRHTTVHQTHAHMHAQKFITYLHTYMHTRTYKHDNTRTTMKRFQEKRFRARLHWHLSQCGLIGRRSVVGCGRLDPFTIACSHYHQPQTRNPPLPQRWQRRHYFFILSLPSLSLFNHLCSLSFTQVPHHFGS